MLISQKKQLLLTLDTVTDRQTKREQTKSKGDSKGIVTNLGALPLQSSSSELSEQSGTLLQRYPPLMHWPFAHLNSSGWQTPDWTSGH